jgi:hypothetical protein
MWMRFLALGLSTVWAVWWTFFAVASSVGEVIGGKQPSNSLPLAIVLVLLSSVVVAWRWPMVGGVLFAAFGLLLLWSSLYLFNNPARTTWFLVLTLSLPPFIAGLLMLVDVWHHRSADMSEKISH